MGKPAIVIAAYNRPLSLNRLLSFINLAVYPDNDIPLIISIDGGGDNSVKDIAESFTWRYGEKKIIQHNNNLGLKEHILSCGNLTNEYGSIIMLEDDLVVSPGFYNYAYQALSAYAENPQIAGVSLYLCRANENASWFPFVPLDNGYDAFFMQVPSSCGQAWTSGQWNKFMDYYQRHPSIPEVNKLPSNVANWPSSSWKKHFYNYMVEKDLYFSYPYISLTSNWGDRGTHFDNVESMVRTRLSMLQGKKYVFPSISITDVVYDGFFEIMPEYLKKNGFFPEYDFGVDLLGTKDLSKYSNQYFLSIKNSKHTISQFGGEMIPLEQNVVFNNNGSVISFAEKITFCNNGNDDALNKIVAQYYSSVFQYGYWTGMAEGERKKSKTSSYKVGRIITSPYRFLQKFFLKK